MQHKIQQNLKGESKTNRKIKQKQKKRIIKTIQISTNKQSKSKK